MLEEIAILHIPIDIFTKILGETNFEGLQHAIKVISKFLVLMLKARLHT
jgi:hypothetical protein